MGLILPQTVSVSLDNSRVHEHYQNKGYIIPKTYNTKRHTLSCSKGSKIEVSVLDLSDGSNIKIKVICDICGEEHDVMYCKYINKFQNKEYICSNIKRHKEINARNDLDRLTVQLKEFFKLHGRFPRCDEYTSRNNLDPYYRFREVAKLNNTSLNDMLANIDCFKPTYHNIKYYNNYIEEFIRLFEENKVLNLYEFIRSEGYCLPDIRWLIDNCPETSVKSGDDFLNWLGLYNSSLSKENVIQLITDLQKNLNRPLMYDDFRNREYGKPTLQMVRRYWGTVNTMKKELGLTIIQDDMIGKAMDIKDVEKKILEICNEIYNIDGRKTLISSDFKGRDDIVDYNTIAKYIKRHYKISMNEYLNRLGFSLVEPGRGLKYTYDDGEETTSKYEYVFSNYLRNLGFEYNKDYFRNVYYREIADEHNSARNCDYMLLKNNRKLYIEIAGVLNEYKNWYYQNRTIESSRSKEEYRLKLREKEEVLICSGVEYFILFPCDLTMDFLDEILNGEYLETKKKIETHYKNNINWSKVLRMGELKYDYSHIGRDGNYNVLYAE